MRQEDGAFRAVSGVGLSSGRRYRVLSKDKIISHVFKNGVDIGIFSHTLHTIGQGPGANLIIKGQLQVTFLPTVPQPSTYEEQLRVSWVTVCNHRAMGP